jgi:hypothetical protein
MNLYNYPERWTFDDDESMKLRYLSGFESRRLFCILDVGHAWERNVLASVWLEDVGIFVFATISCDLKKKNQLVVKIEPKMKILNENFT